MKRKKRNILLSILIGAFLLCAIAGGTFYYYLFAPQFHPSKTVYIYVDRDDTADSIYHKIKEFGHVNKFAGFRWMAKYKDFDQNIHTGRYAIRPNDNVYHVYSRFSRGFHILLFTYHLITLNLLDMYGKVACLIVQKLMI